MATLLSILLAIVFICGAPLFTIMLGGTALGALFGARGFEADFDGAIVKLFGVGTGEQVNVLSTIPLFIYAGYLLAEARTADRLVRFANALLGWLPGGLAIVTIGTCALFTVFTGASGVTIIALGGVLMPALVRHGYPERFSLGLIAGTGAVGLLFPPALPLFIYGTVYGLTNLDPENWNTERFLFAGIVPGLVLVGMLSAVAMTVAIYKKLPRQKFELGELGRSFLAALPELFIPFGVILGLASGFGLPEIASLTVLYVVILEVAVFRTVGARVLWAVSYEAMAMIGAIFVIIFASTAFTDFMVNAEVPKKLVIWTQEHVDSKVVFLLAINVILLIVGTVMDIFSAIVVVLPLIAPIAKAYGIDPYHLGVIFLLNLEIGYLHPPVGLNLFLTSVKFRRPITEVMWATVPFLVTMVVALIVITYVPSLTVVPEPERTAPIRNLVELVHDGLEESRVSFAEVTLVDAQGTPLTDAAGKPITRRLKSCQLSPRCKEDVPDNQRCEAGATCESGVCVRPGVETIRDETQRTTCQSLFFEVTTCRPDPKVTDPAQIACANEAIASWVVGNLNSDALEPEKAIVIVREATLADDEGNPIAGKDGRPIVRQLAACDKLTGTERENCRALFVELSSCRIKPHDVTECTAEKVQACPAEGGQSGEDCAKEARAACVGAAIEGCSRDAIASWAEENEGLYKE
ncbi:MAG TPA: TRAP transporter large permease [Kofleriaceae bacterium]|nr:TRAP transporter large permease [Kofleriaceae bacterium]